MTDCILKLCAHRALDGTKCQAPAKREADYCRHHLRVYRPAILPAYIFEARTVRDFELALHRTINDIMSGAITAKLGGQILHELDKRIRALRATLQS